MSVPSIDEQVAEFNVGFAAQIGPDLDAVFAHEQADLVEAGVPASVVAVGSDLPDADLLDPSGAPVALRDAVSGAPAVIVFYRGSWCPYCNLTLRHYQLELLPKLEAAGVRLVAISPQTPEGSELSIANGELAFPVLSDAGNVLAQQLGILTSPSAEAIDAHTALGFAVADSNADASAAIPFPTVLVVDASGSIRFVDVHVDYTTRTEVDDIVAAVAAL